MNDAYVKLPVILHTEKGEVRHDDATDQPLVEKQYVECARIIERRVHSDGVSTAIDLAPTKRKHPQLETIVVDLGLAAVDALLNPPDPMIAATVSPEATP